MISKQLAIWFFGIVGAHGVAAALVAYFSHLRRAARGHSATPKERARTIGLLVFAGIMVLVSLIGFKMLLGR